MKRNERIDDATRLIDGGRSVFITGRAGTGKSTLLARIVSESPSGTAVVAPTGVAALNVGGQTIHRFFGFPTSVTPDDLRTGVVRPRRNISFISRLRRLIIDEVSMVRADLMDCIDVALRKWGPNPRQPFGGVQMVFVGDPYQLPPVVTKGETVHFTGRYETPYFFSADAFGQLDYEFVELTTVFRQHDQLFIEVLNAVRDGSVSDEQLELLNTRVEPDFVPPADEVFITLASTRRLADDINEARLGQLPGQLYTSAAEIRGNIPNQPTKPELWFKRNAQVMMLTNDPASQWVNGSLGVIDEVDLSEPAVRVRLAESGKLVEVGLHQWTITKPMVLGESLAYTEAGTFRQFPFDLAWAVTIHKSQGKSFDQAVVDLGTGAFAEGQLYVALSRCRSLDGLVLRRPVRKRDVIVHPTVVSFLAPHQPVVSSFAAHEPRDPKRWQPKPPKRQIVFDEPPPVDVTLLPKRRHINKYTHLELRAVVRHVDTDNTASTDELVEAVCKFLGYPGPTPGRTELISRAITAEHHNRPRPAATSAAARRTQPTRASQPPVDVKQLPKRHQINKYTHLELRAVVRHVDTDHTASTDELVEAVCKFLGYPGSTPGRTELISRAITAEHHTRPRRAATSAAARRTQPTKASQPPVDVKWLPKRRPINKYTLLELRAVVRHVDPDNTASADVLVDAVCKFLGYPGSTPGRTTRIRKAIATDRRNRPRPKTANATTPAVRPSTTRDIVTEARVNVERIPKGRHIDTYTHLELRAVVRHLNSDGTMARKALVQKVCRFLGYPESTPERSKLIGRAITAEYRQTPRRVIASQPPTTIANTPARAKRSTVLGDIGSYTDLELQGFVRHLDPDGSADPDELFDAVCIFLGQPEPTPGRNTRISKAIATDRRNRPRPKTANATTPAVRPSTTRDIVTEARVNVERIPKGRHIDAYTHLELRAVVRHLNSDGTMARKALVQKVCRFLGYPESTPERSKLIGRAITAEYRHLTADGR